MFRGGLLVRGWNAQSYTHYQEMEYQQLCKHNKFQPQIFTGMETGRSKLHDECDSQLAWTLEWCECYEYELTNHPGLSHLDNLITLRPLITRVWNL